MPLRHAMLSGFQSTCAGWSCWFSCLDCNCSWAGFDAETSLPPLQSTAFPLSFPSWLHFWCGWYTSSLPWDVLVVGWAAGSRLRRWPWVGMCELGCFKIALCGKRCQSCDWMGFPAQLTQSDPPYLLLKYLLDFVLSRGEQCPPACPVCLWTLVLGWWWSF